MGGGDDVDRETVFVNYRAVTSPQFRVSLAVEFIGNMFFMIIAAAGAKEFGPFVAGFSLAVWVYASANISGGHLNPAVTVSLAICGFYPVLHSILYICLQIVGAICGSLVLAGLVPDASVQMGAGGPGCLDRSEGGVISPKITDAQLFGWEVVMTFTLISTVYACGVSKPGHGSHTPFAVGLSVVCCAGSGGQYTGAAMNPAQVIGPASVFFCGTDVMGIYIAAQLFAAVLACGVYVFVSGFGPLSPFISSPALELSKSEAMNLWITGSPPKRMQKTGRENVADFAEQYKQYYERQYLESEASSEDGSRA